MLGQREEVSRLEIKRPRKDKPRNRVMKDSTNDDYGAPPKNIDTQLTQRGAWAMWVGRPWTRASRGTGDVARPENFQASTTPHERDIRDERRARALALAFSYRVQFARHPSADV
ncbi:hypothetical protein EVAR_22531_1 [Eumeta japonica]|uniref:Uncharacterized protein n=1 Tax=Eumeta variegata TaxID=151549 RepID=A0A4C1U7A0_EUMVA|nr:hypothetical protein EVAR_22531_1 [Eumeta japonica]